MRILITGFGAFGGITDNPSARLLEQFAADGLPGADELYLEQLPVAYRQAGERIRELLDRHVPDLCICLGVAGERRNICLERIAMNLDDCALADNDEDLARDREIVPGAALALRTKLPLTELVASLNDAAATMGNTGAPGFAVSNHAGNFVCNHVYFNALEHVALKQLPTNCLFIHVPLSRETNAENRSFAWEPATQDQLREMVGELIAGLVKLTAGTGLS